MPMAATWGCHEEGGSCLTSISGAERTKGCGTASCVGSWRDDRTCISLQCQGWIVFMEPRVATQCKRKKAPALYYRINPTLRKPRSHVERSFPVTNRLFSSMKYPEAVSAARGSTDRADADLDEHKVHPRADRSDGPSIKGRWLKALRTWRGAQIGSTVFT